MKFNIKKSVMLASIIIGALWISGCATSTPAPVAPINKAIDIPKDTIAGCITGEQIEQIDLSHMLQNFSGVSSMENSLKAYDSEKHSGALGMLVTKENNTTYNINYIYKLTHDDMSIFPRSDYTIINVIMFPLHLTSVLTERLIRHVIFGPFEPSSTVSYTFDIAKLSDTQIKVSLNTNPTIKRTGGNHYIYPSYYDTYKVRKDGVLEKRDIKQAAKEDIERVFNAFPLTITDYLNKNGDKFHEALYMNNVYINGVDPFLEQAYNARKKYHNDPEMMYNICSSGIYSMWMLDRTFDEMKDIVKKIQADKKDLFVSNDEKKAELVRNRNAQLRRISSHGKIRAADIRRTDDGLMTDDMVDQKLGIDVHARAIEQNFKPFYDMLKSFAYITDYEISKYGNDTLKKYVECGRIGKAIDLKD